MAGPTDKQIALAKELGTGLVKKIAAFLTAHPDTSVEEVRVALESAAGFALAESRRNIFLASARSLVARLEAGGSVDLTALPAEFAQLAQQAGAGTGLVSAAPQRVTSSSIPVIEKPWADFSGILPVPENLAKSGTPNLKAFFGAMPIGSSGIKGFSQTFCSLADKQSPGLVPYYILHLSTYLGIQVNGFPAPNELLDFLTKPDPTIGDLKHLLPTRLSSIICLETGYSDDTPLQTLRQSVETFPVGQTDSALRLFHGMGPVLTHYAKLILFPRERINAYKPTAPAIAQSIAPEAG